MIALRYLILIIMLGVFPVILGIFWRRICKKETFPIAAVFCEGTLLMFALFLAAAILMMRLGLSMTKMALCWGAFAGVSSVILGIILRKEEKQMLQGVPVFWKKSQIVTRILGVAAIVLTAGAVWIFEPGAADDTVTAVENLFQSSIPYGGMGNHSPFELFYAVLAHVSGIAPAQLLHGGVSVFCLVFFYLAYWRIAQILFEENEHASGVFCLLVTVLFLTPLYVPNQSLLSGIFRNSWNGITLLCVCVLPLILGICLEIFAKKPGFYFTGLLLAGLMTGQLLYVRGGFYAALIVGICLIVWIGKRGYQIALHLLERV